MVTQVLLGDSDDVFTINNSRGQQDKFGDIIFTGTLHTDITGTKNLRIFIYRCIKLPGFKKRY